jgi:hypothetical protein
MQQLRKHASRGSPLVPSSPQVAVTGAGGRTGGLVVKKLIAESDKFTAVPIVRSAKVRVVVTGRCGGMNPGQPRQFPS